MTLSTCRERNPSVSPHVSLQAKREKEYANLAFVLLALHPRRQLLHLRQAQLDESRKGGVVNLP
jgi:hypothetical protein